MTIHFREECEGHPMEGRHGEEIGVSTLCDGSCEPTACGLSGMVLEATDDTDDVTCPDCLLEDLP